MMMGVSVTSQKPQGMAQNLLFARVYIHSKLDMQLIIFITMLTFKMNQ
ncbi:hypothetical protein KPN2242_08075 [Klebsiella pneumoniae KCTC 2242]|nr:hypothetical protein KPN2242_08075 [Klebsiella pneumoniae KCTC 2242]